MTTYLSYLTNFLFFPNQQGFFGVSDSETEQNLYIVASGQSRTLTVPVNFKPIVHISSSDLSDFQSAKVVNYAKGFIHEVSCYSNLDDASKRDISVSRQLFAHRSIPEIFVQQFKIDNPSGQDQYFTGETLL